MKSSLKSASLPFFVSWMLLAFTLANAPDAQAQNEDEWDVTAAHGPTETVQISTNEGTWMNLDVSPDGTEIVFDLLGDIYTMPIDGGEATRVKGGPEFTVQPRYSPDGSRISFTNDEGGGDNIWTMNTDGSDQRQITHEDFRLLNNAAWTPDGDYLIARKHFTSTRSLGAGEMWMYHRSGNTSGVQLTERRTDQKDAGEPVVSPDGRYLYYSEDMTPGETFEYDKDPNEQIYAVRELDLETGELRSLITGPGSALRPQPSPDGDKIAFVRRVRSQSVLFLYDKETGAERPIYDDLSHDQQESWAIFGVYPNYAWMPDGDEIIIWAQGEIRRVDVETGESTNIPFQVDVEKRIAETVHSQQDAWSPSFSSRMMRDFTTSPDGSTVVFHAVGDLWQMSLPNGSPERITQDDAFAYEPAFSPEGNRLVYTTWHDDEYGSIQLLNLNTGEQRSITNRQGYFYEPSFSPDGDEVVYRRGTGSSLLGSLHSTDTGIYRVDAAGGEPTKVTDEGRQPRFDHTGERIYYLTGGGLSKEYHSVDVHGGDKRTHFTMRDATTAVPSPDGQWVAFQDLHNVYVAPFPRTGGDLHLSRDMNELPVQKVSEHVGDYLHWSADGETLHWARGPEYFSQDVHDAFAFDTADDDAVEIDTTGTEIDLTFQSDVPSGQVAFTNARIITMDGDEVIENGTLLVEENRIAAVGANGEVDVPGNAHVVDASGQTIMPGMVDVHAHANHFVGGMLPQTNWPYMANLAFGVTTIHDPSANTETVFSLAELVQAGEIVGPRVFSTGRILYGADGDFRAEVDDLDDARSHLKRINAAGGFSVKSYNQPRRDQRQQVLQAARELDMLVYPEGGSTFFHNMNMIVDGHTGIEHNVPIAPLYDDVLTLWGATNVGYTPTLVVSYGGYRGEHIFYSEENIWEHDRLLDFVPRQAVDPRSRRRVIVPQEEYYHFETARAAKELLDRGVSVQMGSHGQMQGIAAHWETWIFEQGGMTEMEALRVATLNGANYIGMGDEIGSLEEGKLADIIVLDENPLDNIRNTDSVNMVMVNGRLFDAETMDEIGNHPRERGTMFFEREGETDRSVWDEEWQPHYLPH